MTFTIRIYQETNCFPKSEVFGLSSQIRRASSSIPLNIAEGSGCSSNKEFCRFLEISLRSGYETATAIDIARGLQYWSDEIADHLLNECNEIAAMIVGLTKHLQKHP